MVSSLLTLETAFDKKVKPQMTIYSLCITWSSLSLLSFQTTAHVPIIISLLMMSARHNDVVLTREHYIGGKIAVTITSETQINQNTGENFATLCR